jgi:hypothetical protein
MNRNVKSVVVLTVAAAGIAIAAAGFARQGRARDLADARSVAERYVRATLAGNYAEAVKLTEATPQEASVGSGAAGALTGMTGLSLPNLLPNARVAAGQPTVSPVSQEIVTVPVDTISDLPRSPGLTWPANDGHMFMSARLVLVKVGGDWKVAGPNPSNVFKSDVVSAPVP